MFYYQPTSRKLELNPLCFFMAQPENEIDQVIKRTKAFHNDFMQQYRG
jgi:hypothetical protein